MYTTLFFDLGEVILTNDWTFVCPDKDREFTQAYGITEFNYAKNPYTDDLFTGKISERDFWEKALTLYHAKTTDPTIAIAIARKYQREKESIFSLLAQLKKQGYKLGVISNIHKEMLLWKTETFHLDDYFLDIISSCDTGYRKPDKRIYQIALEKLHVTPEESMFIDDNEHCVHGAEAVGMTGVIFTSQNLLIQTLATYGIYLP